MNTETQGKSALHFSRLVHLSKPPQSLFSLLASSSSSSVPHNSTSSASWSRCASANLTSSSSAVTA
eukprot:m.118326 g.118326  ORF g.118326 m.118326 type:complete len:66 (+) comp23121_c0_seq1:121-318(+)